MIGSPALAAILNEVEATDDTIDDRLAALEALVQTLKQDISALHQWRHDLRHEFKLVEVADITEIGAGGIGTIYELPDAYDPTVPFVVFNGVVKILATQLSLAALTDTGDAAKRFSCSVSLGATRTVMYFKRVPDPSAQTFL